MYGMPLRVTAPEIGPDDKRQIAALEQRREETRRRIEALPAGAKEEKERLAKDLAAVDAEIAVLKKSDHSASVDSEIALVAAGDYPLAGWVPNPFFMGNRKRSIGHRQIAGAHGEPPGRADREDRAAHHRRFAGGRKAGAYPERPISTPAGRSRPKRRRAATSSTMRPSTGPRGALPRAAGCRSRSIPPRGFFSPATARMPLCTAAGTAWRKYVDAFTWKPGAVAYHIASSECATLKQKGSRVWCKRMLEEGAAAVIGPVEEPYVEAFPVPEIFFALLVDGYLTLAECYAAGTPWLSWRMVLIGDPLYRPFANAKAAGLSVPVPK